jgi:hypothetical protein
MEAVVSLVIFLVGAPVVNGPLKKISWESYMQSR